MAKILIVEDDMLLSKTIAKMLSLNYEVHVLSSGLEALRVLNETRYDLIVLDLGLPDCGGIEVCQRFRQSGGNTPVLILTGKKNMPEKKQGFEAGADDYLTKPFDMQELEMRLSALLRRSPQLSVTGNSVAYENLVIDLIERSVSKNGDKLKLLPSEFALLEFFVKNPRVVFSAEMILDRVWKSDSETSPDAVRIYITRLRRKVDDADRPSVIETVHGVGYRLREPVAGTPMD